MNLEYDKHHVMLGKAFVERRELKSKIDDLRERLAFFSRVVIDLVENSYFSRKEDYMERCRNDPKEDWYELRRSLERLDELDEILGA